MWGMVMRGGHLAVGILVQASVDMRKKDISDMALFIAKKNRRIQDI